MKPALILRLTFASCVVGVLLTASEKTQASPLPTASLQHAYAETLADWTTYERCNSSSKCVDAATTRCITMGSLCLDYKGRGAPSADLEASPNR